MKKLAIVLTVTTALMSGTTLADTATVDFEALATGATVEGEGAVHPLLNIQNPVAELQVIEEGQPSGLWAYSTGGAQKLSATGFPVPARRGLETMPSNTFLKT